MDKKQRVGLFQRIRNVAEKANKLERDTLHMIKKGLFGFIVVDMFGIYYFLGMKQLGLALMVVSAIGIVIVLYLLNSKEGLDFNTIRKTAQDYLTDKKYKGGNKKMETEQVVEQKQSSVEEEPKKPAETVSEEPEDKKEKKEEPVKEEPKEEVNDPLGIGTSEEYNKRLEGAFGSV